MHLDPSYQVKQKRALLLLGRGILNAIPLILFARGVSPAIYALLPLEIAKMHWARSLCKRGRLHPSYKVKWKQRLLLLGRGILNTIPLLLLACGRMNQTNDSLAHEDKKQRWLRSP
jgi:EamA domain-containing membrane protein RarD